MAVTYEPIASTTLGSASASIEFTSISGTYTDLILVIRASVITTPAASWLLTVNSDTGTNYSTTWLYGNGTAAASSRGSSGTFIRVGAANDGDSTWSTMICHLMSYANTNVYKTVLASYSNSAKEVSRTVGLWRSTSAITSVKMALGGSGQFDTSTVASLYGIKAA